LLSSSQNPQIVEAVIPIDGQRLPKAQEADYIHDTFLRAITVKPTKIDGGRDAFDPED
jgi:hypothetical protein